jgi:hypothetical protein
MANFPVGVSTVGSIVQYVWMTLVGVFYTDKIQGGQDNTFLFQGGLANYKAHYGLFWFKPLLGGNSPTSTGLILKMNSGCNDLSRELKKFTK